MAALAQKLCEAIENEDAKEVEILLKCGADPNLVLPNGIAAIHLASGKENESALRCLTLILQHGGDPNVRSIEALTPIHVAASWGCCKALIFLLQKGGDPSLQDQDGNTALDLALMESNRRSVVALQEYSERRSDDCPDQNHGYCKNNSCLTDGIPEMSSITVLLESSYDITPLNSTKISPSPPRNVTPGNGMNHAVLTSQTELSDVDTKLKSRKKHEISTGMVNSKLGLNITSNKSSFESKPITTKGVSVTWWSQPTNSCEDSSTCWQSDLINEDNLLINTEIEWPDVCTLGDSNFQGNGLGNKVKKDITLSNHFCSHTDSAFMDILKTNEELNFNKTSDLLCPLVLERRDVTTPDCACTYSGHSNNGMEKTPVLCTSGNISRGENVEGHQMSNSSQTECYTSSWENSFNCDKKGWDSGAICRISHSNQISSQNREGLLSCAQKHSCKPSVIRDHSLPEIKKDVLLMDANELTGTSTVIGDHKEETGNEHADVSFQSETLTINHESKIARTSGMLCTSQSPTFAVWENCCHESNSQECNLDLQNLILLTKGGSLNVPLQSSETVHSLVEAEGSCPDTVRVSVNDTKAIVKNDLSINQSLKNGNSSTSDSSADTLISELKDVDVTEKSDPGLSEQLRKMMLATKVFQSPSNSNGEKNPCFFTPRSKSRLLSFRLRNDSSLFDDSVEMPTRGMRVRSPDGISPSPLQSNELGLKKNVCTNRVLFEQNHISDTSPTSSIKILEKQIISPLTPSSYTPKNHGKNISAQESSVNTSDFLTDDLSSSETEVKSSLQFKQAICANRETFESEWLTEDADSESTRETIFKSTVDSSTIKEKSLSASLVNGSFLHSTAAEGTAVNCSKVPRFSFSRLSCVPKIGNSVGNASLTSTINESGTQEMPLSPGGRPVNVSQVEPVEYLYMDNENGHALIEKHIPCKDQCVTNISENVDNTIFYDWRNFKNSNQKDNKVLSAQPPNRVAVELYRLSNNEISRRLKELGENTVQVNSQTRKTCILLLDKRLKEQSTSDRAGFSFEYSPELSVAFRTFHIPDCNSDEAILSLEFDQPDKTRKWREGVLKSSFNYLLLDPRVTQNLPARYHSISQHDCFRTFVRAIFYVGKGKRSRPYCHLYEALTYYKGSYKQSCPKVQHILDIWKSGQGVLSLHCFQNTIPSEAYTREACMVDAIGLKKLSNQKNGVYYGQSQYWIPTRRRSLGVHMLYRAMQIFLAEGERQLRPPDICTRS